METRLTQLSLEDQAVSLITALEDTSVRLVTAGPTSNPLALVGDFTEASFPGYTRSETDFDGPYLDLGGNPYIQGDASVFLNTGTLNITVTGAIGVGGTVTTPTLSFVYEFASPAIIPASGTLNVPNKVALPLTAYIVPDPVI